MRFSIFIGLFLILLIDTMYAQRRVVSNNCWADQQLFIGDQELRNWVALHNDREDILDIQITEGAILFNNVDLENDTELLGDTLSSISIATIYVLVNEEAPIFALNRLLCMLRPYREEFEHVVLFFMESK